MIFVKNHPLVLDILQSVSLTCLLGESRANVIHQISKKETQIFPIKLHGGFQSRLLSIVFVHKYSLQEKDCSRSPLGGMKEM